MHFEYSYSVRGLIEQLGALMDEHIHSNEERCHREV